MAVLMVSVSCFPKLKCGSQGRPLFEIARAHQGLLTKCVGPLGRGNQIHGYSGLKPGTENTHMCMNSVGPVYCYPTLLCLPTPWHTPEELTI